MMPTGKARRAGFGEDVPMPHYASAVTFPGRIINGSIIKHKSRRDFELTPEEKSRKWDETQLKLTKLADEYEEAEVYLHRDLETLPQNYADTMRDYLAAEVRNITLRREAEAWEEKYEKGRGELFDAIHRIDELESQEETTRRTVDEP